MILLPIAFGLYELLRNNAANIHETEDWSIIFILVEMVGAGVTYSSDLDEDSGRGSAGTVSPTTSGGGMPPGSAGPELVVWHPVLQNRRMLLHPWHPL